MQAVRSLLFFIGQLSATLVYWPVTVLAYPLPPLSRSRVIGGWARFVLWWLRVTCNLRHEVEGREHLPPVPTVVLSKHQSAWETIAFQCILPPQAWVLKRELLWIPFFGCGLAASQPIAIDRSAGVKALQELVRQGLDRLRQGRWVVVFPEGTRTAPGEHGRFNPGGAMLAAKAGAPVVPIAHNAGLFWPRRGFIKKPGVIRVVIGPPLDTAGRKPKEINAEARLWIENAMKRLEPEQAA